MLSFFPLDVLDEIWDVIESVSEGFLTYSYITKCLTVANIRLCLTHIHVISVYIKKYDYY